MNTKPDWFTAERDFSFKRWADLARLYERDHHPTHLKMASHYYEAWLYWRDMCNT